MFVLDIINGLFSKHKKLECVVKMDESKNENQAVENDGPTSFVVLKSTKQKFYAAFKKEPKETMEEFISRICKEREAMDAPVNLEGTARG